MFVNGKCFFIFLGLRYEWFIIFVWCYCEIGCLFFWGVLIDFFVVELKVDWFKCVFLLSLNLFVIGFYEYSCFLGGDFIFGWLVFMNMFLKIILILVMNFDGEIIGFIILLMCGEDLICWLVWWVFVRLVFFELDFFCFFKIDFWYFYIDGLDCDGCLF